MAQSEEECGEKMPVVAHKKNRGKWLVTMPEDVFFRLINPIYSEVGSE